MSKFYWRPTSDGFGAGANGTVDAPADGEVNEQHPLPTQLVWRSEGDDEYQPLNEGSPLPVALTAPVASPMWVSPWYEVPGIAAADALDAGDAMGTLFTIDTDVLGGVLPMRGIIIAAKLVDRDDDTLSATLHIFTRLFTPTASDAALAIAAADALGWVTNIPLTTTTDIGGAKSGETTGWNSPYHAPDRKLYCQLSTAGTPNIAAGLMPRVQLFVLPMEKP